MNKQTILIVTNSQGVLVTSLKNNLMEKDYQVQMVAAGMNEVTQVKDDLEAILLYSDEASAANQQLQVYLRDKCVENDISFFIIGDQDELDQISKAITRNSVAKEYTRPINVADVAEDISVFIKEHGKSSKKKVLVVDDSGAMLRNVKGWLEDHYQVILANSGAMAIKYLTLNKPDLVLLDYEMPIIDGKQVLEMIRSEVEFSDVPVIFLTSKGDRESVANVVKLKPDGYLLKTMKPEEIVKTVDDFFLRQKSKKV